ncbi:MAG TPA: cytochrome c biogenesis protein CcsA [Elusimicrobiota bacterium]|nr:cytochrome c biogenesis protein CcsA [Elusimicrobiota bacterium]
MNASLLNSAFFFLLAAFVASLIGRVVDRPWRSWPGRWALSAGWLLLTVSLGHRWIAAGHPPVSNQYESTLFLVWTVAGSGLGLVAVSSSWEVLLPWISAFAVLGLGAMSLMDPRVAPLVPALQSNWLLIHVVTTMLGYAGFTVAFLGALRLLFLRGDPVGSRDIRRWDRLLDQACVIGFFFLTFGIVTGSVWANQAWGSYWSWDPKETWALITWLYYATAFHLRRSLGWTDRRFAGLMVGGMVLVLFTYFGVNYLLGGLHAYR